MNAPDAPTTMLGTNKPQDAAREFPCDSCGARLEFHIGQQQLECPYCGFEKALSLREDETEEVSEHELDVTLARLARGERSAIQLGDMEIECKGCGATVAFTGQLAASECPFCGTKSHREDAHKSETRLKVDAIVPFQVDAAQAKLQLRSWVRRLWFAPNEFRKRGVSGQMNGIYLPFWTYDAMTFCRYMGQRGTSYTVTVGSGENKRTETRIRWRSASGEFDRFFDEVAIPATSSFERKLLLGLEPWPIESAQPFNAELVAGKQSMTYDVDLATGFGQAKELMRDVLDTEARRRIGGDAQRIHHLTVKYSALTYKHTLFPVWMLAYMFDGRSYQVVVNAITGEVQGQRPWSKWKILGVVMLVLAGIGAFLYFRQ